MKKISRLSVFAMLAGMALFSSCGPKCKECQIDSGLGISVSMGELCGDDLKVAQKTQGVSCK